MAEDIIIDNFTDVDGKLVISPNDTLHKKYEIGNEKNKTLEQCKNICIENKECIFVQYHKSIKECRYYRLLPSSNLFQWQNGETVVFSYSLPFSSVEVNPPKSLCSPEECNYQCQIDDSCLYSISTYDKEEENNIEKKEVCHRYSGISNSDYILSYYNKVSEKLNIPLPSQLNNTSNNQESILNEPGASDFYYRDEIPKYSSSLLYGLTIVILVLVAIILFICKRRSDKEKELLYVLSNMNGNSQSRSRSKSVHSENLSYINNTRLSASFFQNNYNLSSISITPDNLDNSKFTKNTSKHSATNLKKSFRKSISSKAPSIHSISTLCTSTSVNNANTHTHSNNNNTNTNTNNNTNTSTINGQGDSTLNEKSSHLPPLTTKKNSTYNYSIKTLSTKDPSLTGLSQNIKNLFANSYSGDTSSILLNSNNNESYSFNGSSVNGNGSNARASISGSIITKDFNYEKLFKDNNNNNSNTNVKNILNHHKKQSSSVSITIPISKVASSPSMNKNITSSTTPQPKMVKLKKTIHTKQISISRSVYSESELSLNNEELDKNNIYLDAQETLSLNTISNNNASVFKYK